KPGLTGWAQINLSYTSTDHEARMKLEYDLFYVRYGSLFLDIAILLQTVRYLMALKTRKATQVLERKQDLPYPSEQQAGFTLQTNDIVRKSWSAVSDPATH